MIVRVFILIIVSLSLNFNLVFAQKMQFWYVYRAIGDGRVVDVLPDGLTPAERARYIKFEYDAGSKSIVSINKLPGNKPVSPAVQKQLLDIVNRKLGVALPIINPLTPSRVDKDILGAGKKIDDARIPLVTGAVPKAEKAVVAGSKLGRLLKGAKEWAKVAKRWTLRGIGAAVVGGVIYKKFIEEKPPTPQEQQELDDQRKIREDMESLILKNKAASKTAEEPQKAREQIKPKPSEEPATETDFPNNPPDDGFSPIPKGAAF